LDWNAAVEKHREALKRVLATLVAMAGFPVLHACGGATLPRRLHRALLALLRPAEAAARRLVIVAARGLVVELTMGGRKPVGIPNGGGGTRATPPRPGFRLFDPLPRWARRTPQAAVPRISVPGFNAPFPIMERRAPSPHDPIGAAPLARRLQTLGSVLDDLPRHARRFARWQAAKAEKNDPRPGRFRRIWPLRPGRPPGHRSRRRRRSAHEVHAVLDDLHGLALWALGDTS